MQFNVALSKFKEWKSMGVKSNTVKGYDSTLRHFCIFIRNRNIEDIKLDDVVEWFKLQALVEYESNTFIPRAMALRKFFEFFQHQKYEVLNPWLIPIPKKEYKFPRVATEEQFKKLINVVPTNPRDPRHVRNHALIRLYWDTGARNSEILALNIQDIDLEGMCAVIRTEKPSASRPARKIMWTKPTNDALKAWIKKREHLKTLMVFREPDALFISVVNAKSGYRLRNSGMAEVLRRYSNLAGIPYVNAHSMRHHMGHDLAKKKYNNSVISGMLGHSSLTSSFVYTMLNNVELEEIYRGYKQEPSTEKLSTPTPLLHSKQLAMI